MVSGLVGCVYLDDVIIFRDIWDERLQRIHALFDKALWAKWTINLVNVSLQRQQSSIWVKWW